jgi:hypothetical protein
MGKILSLKETEPKTLESVNNEYLPSSGARSDTKLASVSNFDRLQFKNKTNKQIQKLS